MSESFEAKLIARASKDVFKKAKQILRNGELLCCHEAGGGTLRAVFRDQKGLVSRVEAKGFPDGPYSSTCSCESDCGCDFCAHAMAAFLYHAKYTIKKPEDEIAKDSPALYGGLKFSELPELLSQVLVSTTAYVKIDAESEFPHVPSKWERTIFSVSLHANGRDYAGNLNNLRQLHFGKNLAAALQLSAFPQQHRQIIRYLAINAQQDGTKLSLDAEQTAEFFHCLVEFQNFNRLGEKVIIHREIAEPVILLERVKSGSILRSAIVVKDSPLPLKDVKVVTGRSGCWVGMLGEYWWIPAQTDVAWLRSFLRTTVQPCDDKSADMLVAASAHMPIKLIETDGVKVKQKKFKPLYDGVLKSDGTLDIEILFDYEGRLCKGDNLRLASSGGNFWRRNSKAESEIVAELVNFGFMMIKGASSEDGETKLRLRDREAIGVFVDELVPHWLSSGREFLLSSNLAALCGDSSNMKISCAVVGKTDSYYDLSVELTSAGIPVAWRDIVQAAKNNEFFISTASSSGNLFIKVPPQLRKLVFGVHEIAQSVNTPVPGKKNVDVLRIPRFAALHWARLGAEIPGAVPQDFLRLKIDVETAAEDAASGEFNQGTFFKGELRKYQSAGVMWMKTLGARGYNLILADEMGLGKTIQTLALLSSDPAKNLPALILCPTSLLENWAREAGKFVPTLKTVIITGHDRRKLWDHALSCDICISSYSLVKRDFEHLSNLKFKYLILDEAQHIKNPFTANAQTCKMIQSDHKLVLTGTPLENSPEDLWSIFDFLHPGILGSLGSFRAKYTKVPRKSQAHEDLSSRIAPFILRRKKAEVHSELPPKTEQVLYCEMDHGQRKLYEAYLEEGRKQCELLKAKSGSMSNFEILSTLLRLRQICCHPQLLPEKLIESTLATIPGHHETAVAAAAGTAVGAAVAAIAQAVHEQHHHILRSAKMELLQELLLESIESGHKVLLFSQFTSLLKIVREWLDSVPIRYEYLDGSTKDRMARVDSFNNSKNIPLFLLSLKAGGLGLNLTSADTVIIYDPWWNPAVESQAADRTHRIGQTKNVNCMKLVVKSSVEEKVLELQRSKAQLFDKLVEAPSEALRSMSIEDLEFILRG